MKLKEFKLEVFFGKHEFTAPYLLTQSDCEAMTIKELLTYESDSEVNFLNEPLGYTEVQGNPKLRNAISNLYKTINPEEILVHVGAQEPIFNFMNVLLQKDDHVICQFPIYQSLFEVANAIGCEISKWSIEQGDHGWLFDIEKLEGLIKPNTRLLCLNSPNNPTGYTLKKEEMYKIVEIARKYDIFIFCDEVYKGIELDGINRPWFADCYEKGISLGAMSKAYGLAGLRVGWIATKDHNLIKEMKKFKHYTSICTSGPSEYLATIALKHSDKILKKNKKIIEDNLKTSDIFFEKYSHLFEYNRPMAGPVAFHKINIDMPIHDFCERLVSDQGVLLLPSDIYLYDGQYFRMGYGRTNFKDSLLQFEEYLIANKYV